MFDWEIGEPVMRDFWSCFEYAESAGFAFRDKASGFCGY